MTSLLCAVLFVVLLWSPTTVDARVNDAGTLPAKQLAGPPSEFPLHTLPDPVVGTLKQQSAFITASLSCSQICDWNTALYVDNDAEFRFGVFAPQPAGNATLLLTLTDPQGNQVPIENYAHPGQFQISSDGSHGIDGTTYILTNPIVGSYSLRISSAEYVAPRENNLPHAAIILWNESPIQINSHMNSYALMVGSEVGLVSDVVDISLDATAPLQDVISTAAMTVMEPDGVTVQVPMHDDGLHHDKAANDGIYGAYIKPASVGNYRFQATLTGKTSTGANFIRSTEHVVPVIDTQIVLGTVATSAVDNSKEVLTIYLPVDSSANADGSFRPYAEVWATDASGNLVAACWLSTITQVQEVNGAQVLPLQLNLKWLSLANAQAPIVLQNVYIQDANTHVPVVTAAQISVKTPQNFNQVLTLPHLVGVTEITQEMKKGKNPLPKPVDGKTGLVLVHGYCSDINQFQKYAGGDFTDAYYFLNANANVNNDQFAQLVATFAQSNGLTSFSLIAHSQGGMASTHLHNYYWSGLEYATGGRFIQSVGTPYLGNAGAGCAAELGKIFGLTCGANTDLTVDGANLWVAGITSDTRADVYYHTTTYELGNFFGDWCSLPMNLVLSWPNDGVCEFDNAHLPNANNMGNIEKWCHSEGLAYETQCADHRRNQEMNQKAAR